MYQDISFRHNFAIGGQNEKAIGEVSLSPALDFTPVTNRAWLAMTPQDTILDIMLARGVLNLKLGFQADYKLQIKRQSKYRAIELRRRDSVRNTSAARAYEN